LSGELKVGKQCWFSSEYSPKFHIE